MRTGAFHRWAPGFGILIGLEAKPAFAAKPLQYLNGFGPKAYPVVALTWGLLAISIIVVVVISLLVIIGIWRRRVPGHVAIAATPVVRGGNGLRWIFIGVGISGITLLGSLIWTMVVLAAVNGPPTPAKLTIDVTGQQWWWSARYLSSDPSRIFMTADEVHIPVGQPVQIRLIGADVIHSFWVPALSGQTYAIPGQTNVIWIEASHPGRYRGQCNQYCGVQHAHMIFYVVADPPRVFQAWWSAQLRPAPAPRSSIAVAGEQLFLARCGACHTVRGSGAGGVMGPDLTHLMSRNTLAGGMLENTIGNLSGWIANPQAVKPGTLMPTPYLSGPELHDIATYLETLR